MNRPPLTRSGAERLRAELAHLKQKVRTEITAAIGEARAHGDLKENAEYHAAREQQAFVEGRIQRLETTLFSAQVIDVAKLTPNGRVVFGVTVTVADEETGEKTRYQIVGDLESDLKENRIAVSSPIARALIGKDEGDVVSLRTPGGVRDLEIVAVEYL